MIGKEIGSAGHLLRGEVDIGDRGLPTRSHGKMGEVIDLSGGRADPRQLANEVVARIGDEEVAPPRPSATPEGELSRAEVAGPPSPLNPPR